MKHILSYNVARDVLKLQIISIKSLEIIISFLGIAKADVKEAEVYEQEELNSITTKFCEIHEFILDISTEINNGSSETVAEVLCKKV